MTEAMHIVIPVKGFAAAKRRLSPLLSPPERADLARAMLADVLAALASCRGIADVTIVTSDGEAAEQARRAGAVVLREPQAAGINRAVDVAAREFNDGSAMLVVPADLPEIAAGSVDAVAAALTGSPAVAIVAASADRGTNLLALRPADAIPPCFGLDSAGRHVAAARAASIEPLRLAFPDIARDVDTPEDLVAFFRRGSATHSRRLLERIGFAERLGTVREMVEDE